jgi:CheY-like chemotaxis protein
MPIMNGYQFMDRLKELPETHTRHVIVVAAASNDVPPGTPVVKKPVDMKLLLRYMAAHGDEQVSH